MRRFLNVFSEMDTSIQKINSIFFSSGYYSAKKSCINKQTTINEIQEHTSSSVTWKQRVF